MKRVAALHAIVAVGALLQSAGCRNIFDDPSECAISADPQGPQLVPATLADIADGVEALIEVQDGYVSLTLTPNGDESQFPVGYDPSRCPQLSATVTLNGVAMLASSPEPVQQEARCSNSYLCASPSFRSSRPVPTTSTMDFVLTDSSGSHEVKIALPPASINGADVLAPNHVASVTFSDPSGTPNLVVVGAPEVGVVFADLTSLVQPTANGFSFVMPSTDLSVSSSNLVDPDWDAGASSCGLGGATLPCNAALEIRFPALFEKCDFASCLVPDDSSSYGAPSGTVLLPVTLAVGADAAAGAVDASDGG